jgi:hypothetical protein
MRPENLNSKFEPKVEDVPPAGKPHLHFTFYATLVIKVLQTIGIALLILTFFAQLRSNREYTQTIEEQNRLLLQLVNQLAERKNP